MKVLRNEYSIYLCGPLNETSIRRPMGHSDKVL
ncbi:MAG: hypothetical protein ACI898_001573, partial [Flavobacteriales bacterium]